MGVKRSRNEITREKYNRIVKATGNVDLARRYRYITPIRIKRELGIDITVEPKSQKIKSRSQWGRMASARFKEEYPLHVQAYAVQKNREVGADDFDGYGFIYAYKRLVENKGDTQIKREIIFSKAEGTFIYTSVRSAE
jgi:hypothetical protein